MGRVLYYLFGSMNRLSSASRIVAAKEQVSSDLGDEAAILNLKSGVYYGLDSVGARVWELVREPRTVSELRDLLLKEYAVDAEQLERDLLALFQEMESEGLIDVLDDAGG